MFDYSIRLLKMATDCGAAAAGGAAAEAPLPAGMAYGEAPEDRPFQIWMEKIRKQRKGDVLFLEQQGEEEAKEPKAERDEFFTNWYTKTPVKVAYLEGKGRSLVAARDLQPNDVILRCFPYTWAADEKYGSIICRYCLAEKLIDEDNPFSCCCPHCNQVWYCSEACKLSDASVHRGYECMMLSSWELDPQVYEPDVITEMKLLVRTVALKHYEKRLAAASKKQASATSEGMEIDEDNKKSKSEGTNGSKGGDDKEKEEKKEAKKEGGDGDDDELLSTEPDIEFEDYEALISRPYDFPGDMIEGLKFWICDYLSRLGAWLGLEESAESLLLQLIRNRLNSFSIWNEPSMRQRGIGVYVTPSFINHDCNPNISLKRYSTSLLEFYAARPIKEGEELSISYVDTAEELDVRRQKLRSTYLFLCRCQRCIHEDLQRPPTAATPAPDADAN